MNVPEAEAQLALAKTEDKYREAKTAYQADAKKKPAFIKARNALVAARDEWRNNWRTSSDGPGDASVAPAPVSASLEVS